MLNGLGYDTVHCLSALIHWMRQFIRMSEFTELRAARKRALPAVELVMLNLAAGQVKTGSLGATLGDSSGASFVKRLPNISLAYAATASRANRPHRLLQGWEALLRLSGRERRKWSTGAVPQKQDRPPRLAQAVLLRSYPIQNPGKNQHFNLPNCATRDHC